VGTGAAAEVSPVHLLQLVVMPSKLVLSEKLGGDDHGLLLCAVLCVFVGETQHCCLFACVVLTL
jgi:hypothetical protein